MSEFINAGLELGTTTNNLIFSIVSENVVKTNATINVDDIYYYKTDVLPISITGVGNTKNSAINIYQPNPNEICITGIDIDTEIKLTNLSGLCVLKTSSNDYEMRIPTNNLPKSVYIIRIGDTVGKILLK
ncbi:MAG: T9SS type A sorting domain-containing protein [Bacteroidia bacterium]|nr:T9SS type A sorting domain-containing protein [Bacteroidia bacterium]